MTVVHLVDMGDDALLEMGMGGDALRLTCIQDLFVSRMQLEEDSWWMKWWRILRITVVLLWGIFGDN